jgi:hypothetical protein
VGLAGGVFLGLIFGTLAGACAFVIAYAEYKNNWAFHGNAKVAALRTAAVAFTFFFLAGLIVPWLFSLVVPRN